MTPLFNILHDTIKENGAISVGTFMSLCLGHPQHGYYMTREAFGKDGDFITAPEVSQLFGEVMALWCILRWEAMGKPEMIQIVELGPGRGTLMKDLWRGLSACQALRDIVRIHLVEFSPRLQEVQKETLSGLPVTWHMHLDSVPHSPSLIIANEFFDALPVEQAVYHQEQWHQRMVTSDGEDLLFMRGNILQGLPTEEVPEETIYEYAPAATQVMNELCTRLTESGGALLAIDYGDDVPIDTRYGETLQALREHKMVDVFDHPGKSDLTAHVAFASLEMIAQDQGCQTSLKTQREFLTELGIRLRLEKLLANASPEQAKTLQSGVHRLVDPAEMGDLFKVLQVTFNEL